MELYENLEFMKGKGFQTAPFGLAHSESEAIPLSEEMGYPIVLKVPLQIHKTEVGGVVTGINSIYDLKKMGRELAKNLERNKIPASPLIVQKQIKGAEVIVGLKEDVSFNKVVMLGVGGTHAELYKDVSFRVCPINENDAKEMMEETKVMKLLKFRGVSYDSASLKKLLVKISHMDLKEMDLNPLIVNEEGCWIVDVRMKQ